MVNLFLVNGKTVAVKKFQCNSKKILTEDAKYFSRLLKQQEIKFDSR